MNKVEVGLAKEHGFVFSGEHSGELIKDSVSIHYGIAPHPVQARRCWLRHEVIKGDVVSVAYKCLRDALTQVNAIAANNEKGWELTKPRSNSMEIAFVHPE